VQAEKKDGGSSFMCAESSAWRTDSKCSESASDFMTAGEHFGEVIPAVPKGFVRWLQLSNINEQERHKYLGGATDRNVCYIYCGEGDTVPDTRGWQPFGGQLAAAMADRRGSQRIWCLHPQVDRPSRLSAARILEENPVLVSAGVTLDDFSFSRPKSASLAPSAGAAFPLVGGALRCCGCGRWHNVPEHVMHAVRCPSPRTDAVWWMACACCVTSNHFF
jgi:hypothetical protein